MDSLLYGPDEPYITWKRKEMMAIETAVTSPPYLDISEKATTEQSERYHDIEFGRPDILEFGSTSSSSSREDQRKARSPPKQKWWQRPEATWRPSFIQLRPLIGILGLCVTVGCMFASLAVLTISDGQTVESWPIQPTVYLAIITAVANSAIALSRMEAVSVAWWHSAFRGRTIGSLERQWQVTRNPVQAVRYSSYMSLLSVACIAGALVVVDGPLLQRASTVIRGSPSVDATLELTLPPELPRGFSSDMVWAMQHHTAPQYSLLRSYVNKDPMFLDVQGCDGTCTTSALGPGVAIANCTSQTWPISRKMWQSENASWGPWKFSTEGAAHLPFFYMDAFPFLELPGDSANFIVGYMQEEFGMGRFIENSCLIVPAIVKYDITIEGREVHLNRESNRANVVALANNTISADWPMSIMDAITSNVRPLIQANASLQYPTSHQGVDWASGGVLGYNLEMYKYDRSGSGKLWFQDPTPDIISTYNQMMFRGATIAASWSNTSHLIDDGVSINQTVSAKTVTNIFSSDFRWFAGAAIVQVATALLILPMFWGWWTLGGDLSMSPLNTALAFNSPVFKDVNSANGAKGVIKALGGMKVKFGVVAVSEQTTISQSSPGGGCVGGRLGIAESQSVATPQNGMNFRE